MLELNLLFIVSKPSLYPELKTRVLMVSTRSRCKGRGSARSSPIASRTRSARRSVSSKPAGISKRYKKKTITSRTKKKTSTRSKKTNTTRSKSRPRGRSVATTSRRKSTAKRSVRRTSTRGRGRGRGRSAKKSAGRPRTRQSKKTTRGKQSTIGSRGSRAKSRAKSKPGRTPITRSTGQRQRAKGSVGRGKTVGGSTGRPRAGQRRVVDISAGDSVGGSRVKMSLPYEGGPVASRTRSSLNTSSPLSKSADPKSILKSPKSRSSRSKSVSFQVTTTSPSMVQSLAKLQTLPQAGPKKNDQLVAVSLAKLEQFISHVESQYKKKYLNNKGKSKSSAKSGKSTSKKPKSAVVTSSVSVCIELA